MPLWAQLLFWFNIKSLVDLVTFAIIAIVLYALTSSLKLRCAVFIGCLLTDTNSNSARLSWLLPGLPKTLYNSNYCTRPRWQPQPKCVLSNMLGIKSMHPHQTLCHDGKLLFSVPLLVFPFQFFQNEVCPFCQTLEIPFVAPPIETMKAK